jgi:SAM-dependent methyltransferase
MKINGSMTSEELTPQGLTNEAYWEDSWRDKEQRSWGDLSWVQHNYSWLGWDYILRRRLRPGKEKLVLEVGCGGGKWLIYFHKTFGYSVTGCDYSETGCALARRNLALAGIEGTILEQDFFTLKGKFDVIYSHGLIEHFNDSSRVLEKFASLLNPSHGILISLIPNLTGLSGLYHRLLKHETFETHQAISRDQLAGWYEEIGLKNIEVGAVGSLVPSRFPRDKIRRKYPRFYRFFWAAFLRPLTWLANRSCIWLLRRFGVQIESPRFSPYLYAIGER